MVGPEDGGPYRTSAKDARGRPIPDEGPLRVWLDDDLDDRAAPEGWVHLATAREVCFLLLSGRVTELSLDHDLSSAEDEDGNDPFEATRYGKGKHVIDFLDEQHGALGRSLWPARIALHTANANGRDEMANALITAERRHGFTVRELPPEGTKRVFGIDALGEAGRAEIPAD